MNKLVLSVAAVVAFGLIVACGEGLAQTKSQEQISKESPFGASGAFSRPYIESDSVSEAEVKRRLREQTELYPHVQDIGVKWVRPGPDIYWRWVQPTEADVQNGLFDWKDIDNVYGRVPAGVHILATIESLVWGENRDFAFKPGTWEFSSNDAEAGYIRFVKETVMRYDGDGHKDMPGLKNPIQYWQIGNEPALRPLVAIGNLDGNPDWKGYTHLVEITSEAIREIDPKAKIAFPGFAAGGLPPEDKRGQKDRDEFCLPIIQALHGKYIDVFDIHCYASPDAWRRIKEVYGWFRRTLDANGYQTAEIWITETATPSKPFGERSQAINLFRAYIYPLSFGVKKIFWWNMIEGEPPLEVDTPSRHHGLVYDGVGKDDPGYGVKKLAYYTAKKMVEVLEGSDWNDVQAIQEEAGVCIYKFIKNGKPIYVAWWDYTVDPTYAPGKTKEVSLTGLQGHKALVTEAVPKFSSGAEVTDYDTAFAKDTLVISDGAAKLSLGDSPVFVEM